MLLKNRDKRGGAVLKKRRGSSLKEEEGGGRGSPGKESKSEGLSQKKESWGGAVLNPEVKDSHIEDKLI